MGNNFPETYDYYNDYYKYISFVEELPEILDQHILMRKMLRVLEEGTRIACQFSTFPLLT